MSANASARDVVAVYEEGRQFEFNEHAVANLIGELGGTYRYGRPLAEHVLYAVALLTIKSGIENGKS